MIYTNNLAAIENQLDDVSRKTEKETAESIVDDMRSGFAEPKSGRIYAGHQASAPGESPAIELGDLWNSLDNIALSPIGQRVGSTEEKAVWLEFGTSRIAPRPFFIPAMVRGESTLERILRENLRDV